MTSMRTTDSALDKDSAIEEESDVDKGSDTSGRKEIRVWMDGWYRITLLAPSFDMMHFGHANAMRQAKKMGDTLVVGVITDAKIAQHKGPTVFTEDERYKMVQAIKWVDEVVKVDAYGTTLEILDKYKMDFCVHGDDETTTAEGLDPFAILKPANKYRPCRYMEGISTTDLIDRMLQISRTRTHDSDNSLDTPQAGRPIKVQRILCPKSSVFYLTTRHIHQFSEGAVPKSGDKIVYVAGAFDLFHIGHVDFLQKASELGDYLILGLHSDQEVNRYKGSMYPVMTLHERALNVLACRYVSEVVIDAPYTVSETFLTRCKADIVCHGQTPVMADVDGKDPYSVPKRMGKFGHIDSGNTLTTKMVFERIVKHRQDYEARNKAKEAKMLKVSEILMKRRFGVVNGPGNDTFL